MIHREVHQLDENLTASMTYLPTHAVHFFPQKATLIGLDTSFCILESGSQIKLSA